jgi:hypothetical protein
MQLTDRENHRRAHPARNSGSSAVSGDVGVGYLTLGVLPPRCRAEKDSESTRDANWREPDRRALFSDDEPSIASSAR